MSHEQQPEYDRPADNALRTAMSRDAQDAVVHEAVARVGGAVAPKLDSFQAAMGSEGQVQALRRAMREARA